MPRFAVQIYGVFAEVMADYIYLLENRLSLAQQHALRIVREIARERGLTVFLVGGAVRDLTSGSPVRDLDVVVQGNALKLKKEIEKAGGTITGEHEAGQAFFVTFAGGAKVEIGSALSVIYPKPGKPVVKSASILDDLRRRDFTANAMALSLNAGSYGLLMDPLNGVADIENRELRLVSNYGFIEDPIRMVRAVRLMARLGWQMDEKTQARYTTGKEEGYISAASAFQRGYETEEIVHEEDPLRVMRGLEAEGWMAALTPHWNSAKANVAELERLRESQTQLQMQGIHPNAAAANFPLLTAKLSAKEVAELKASFARPGFVREIEALDAEAKEFATLFSSKSATTPSQSWKLLHAARPEAVLQVAHSSKSPAVQAKLKSFYTEWPLASQKIPYALLQEMRIVSELPGYDAFVQSVVFELMDGKLGTVEEMKAFLEPFSPPAPPPPIHLRRPRVAKKEAKASKGLVKKSVAASTAEPETDATSGASAANLSGKTDEAVVAPVPAAKPVKASAKKSAEPVPVLKTVATKGEPTKAETVKKADVSRRAVPAPKPVVKKTIVLKTPIKAVAVKKTAVAARKTTVQKKVPAKAVAKKALVKKAIVKKTVIKKTLPKPVASKVVAKKAVAKKAAPKAPVTKTLKKSPSKAPVKAAAKKVAAKAAAKPVAKKPR
jgi:tRNA nucleotidyltransferase (CCA-adding enzyme)